LREAAIRTVYSAVDLDDLGIQNEWCDKCAKEVSIDHLKHVEGVVSGWGYAHVYFGHCCCDPKHSIRPTKNPT